MATQDLYTGGLNHTGHLDLQGSPLDCQGKHRGMGWVLGTEYRFWKVRESLQQRKGPVSLGNGSHQRMVAAGYGELVGEGTGDWRPVTDWSTRLDGRTTGEPGWCAARGQGAAGIAQPSPAPRGNQSWERPRHGDLGAGRLW